MRQNAKVKRGKSVLVEMFGVVDAVAFHGAAGGGVDLVRVEDDAREGIAFLEDDFVEAVLWIFAGISDVAQVTDFFAVHAFDKKIAGVLIAEVELVGENLRKNDDGGHVGRGFFLGDVAEAEGGAAL